MVKVFARKSLFVSIAALLVICLTCSSCESLRKKFTRQKKHADDESNFNPVLEPEDYPTPENNPIENYKQHYALIKAWYTDLLTELDEKAPEKRQIYTLKQVLDHIDQMRPLVDIQKRAQLQKLANLLSYYRSSLDGPLALRNVSRIESDLRAFDRLLRDQLSPHKMEGSYITPKA